MNRSTDLDVAVIRLASDMPNDTIVILGKCKGLKLHAVLRGMDEVVASVVKEARQVQDIFALERSKP